MPLSETSPLLRRLLSREPSNMPHSEFFPSVSRTLLHLGNRVDRVSIEDICPRNLADVCSEAAFRLVVLLEMRARKLRHKPDSDIWNRWAEKTATAREGDQLNEQIINTWLLFLDEYRTPTEIEQVLWTSFLVSDDSARRVRVVDLLNAECPSHLICHDVVVLSLTNLWKNGPSCRAVDSTAQIGLRYDALCTPRALHFIDLATHLAYFGLLVSYVMHPPSEPTISRTMLEYIGAREILLMVFSSSILIRPWTLFSVPFAMTLSIFLFSIPVVPFAADLSFNFLLLAFVFHTFQLHLSHSPSPLYLLKVDHSLPFVHFIAKGFRRIILPLVLFFVPISILGTSWLSLALADTFFTSPSFIALLPTPMQTRTTVLFMFFALVAAICCSLFIFVVQGLHLDTDASGWDAYSPAVGLAARASFVRTVISYSSPYLFPAPFSLLQALLITVPSFVFRRLGFQTFFARAERILWRTIVGPVGLVCALVVALFP